MLYELNYVNMYASHLGKVIKINKKILRILQDKPRLTALSELYVTYNTSSTEVLYRQAINSFYWCITYSNTCCTNFHCCCCSIIYMLTVKKMVNNITDLLHLFQNGGQSLLRQKTMATEHQK